MPWSRYILGYHGCDAETAAKIVAGNDELRPSQNDSDWLGHGLYFWEDGYKRALRWATEQSQAGVTQTRIKIPAVLGAVIDLGHCLDLIQVEYLDLVKDSHDQMLKLFKDIGKAPPRNAGKNMGSRKLDCAVFESLHKFRDDEKKPPFNTVRAFFTEGDELYPSAGIRQLDHIQICVRDQASITGYFLPRS